jgi:hypothetical protein
MIKIDEKIPVGPQCVKMYKCPSNTANITADKARSINTYKNTKIELMTNGSGCKKENKQK